MPIEKRTETLCVIPARGGSKTVPRKNIRQICGKPLVGYILESVIESEAFDKIILSTDSEEIAEAVVASYDVEIPFIRPSELAQDETPMMDVLRHAVEFFERKNSTYKVVFSVQPTNPFIRPQTLVEAVDLFQKTGCDSVVSIAEILHYHPFRAYKYDCRSMKIAPLTEYTTERFQRKQDRPQVYGMTGGLFARTAELIKNWNGSGFGLGSDVRGVIVSQEEAFDIDTPFEMEVFESLMSFRSGQRRSTSSDSSRNN